MNFSIKNTLKNNHNPLINNVFIYILAFTMFMHFQDSEALAFSFFCNIQ
jgi:hypothetical protein